MVKFSTCFPCVEKAGSVNSNKVSELCFISNASLDIRIQCHVNGHIILDKNWKGWEVWRFTDIGDGNVLITSWTHHSKVLCSNPKGEVFTTKNKHGEWGKWRVEKKSKDGVVIRSVAHGGKVLKSNGKYVWIQEYDGSAACLWSLEPANMSHFSMSSLACDKRIGCNPDRSIFATGNREGWEDWVVEFDSPGFVTIKSSAHHQKTRYLMPKVWRPKPDVKGNNSVTAGDDKYCWKLEPSPHGGIRLIPSTRLDMFLSCVGKGDGCKILLDDGKGNTKSECWYLEPRMPHTINAQQMWTMAGAGALGLGLIVAAPFAVMGVVSSLGFGSGGIAAGSAAAGMMSAEAIAAGGGVVAGGTVATLQSIGAAGLGAAGTAAAMTGGAVVGGSAVGGTAAVVLQNKRSKDCGAGEEGVWHNRSFAGWRSW